MAKDYEIDRPSGVCCRCGRTLAPGEEFVATVVEDGDDFRRDDVCTGCWTDADAGRSEHLGVWRTRVPRPQEKKRLFVDDDLLIGFFQRLDGAAEPARVALRFVLALVLMRKKLLVYDRTETRGDGTEVWRMHFKGSDDTHEVIDPHMDDEKIAAVSRHLGEVLEAEL